MPAESASKPQNRAASINKLQSNQFKAGAPPAQQNQGVKEAAPAKGAMSRKPSTAKPDVKDSKPEQKAAPAQKGVFDPLGSSKPAPAKKDVFDPLG